MSSSSLWVSSEPFEIGILPVPPPSKLDHRTLRKLYAYAKNKGKLGYPRISYGIWKHIACNKLQINEDLAWLYFQTCSAITEHDQEIRLKVAEKYMSCTTDVEKSKWKESCTVDLLIFLLFLYIQHAHVISLKASMVAGEEWPSRARSPDLEGRAGVRAKSLDEHAQITFVQNNLTEILELLVEPDAYGIGADGDSPLSQDALKALSFLILGTDGRDVLTVSDLASRQTQASKSGFSKISRTFSSKKLCRWIKTNLKSNPFGISGCISKGQKLRGRSYSTSCDESLSASLSSSMGEELLRHTRGMMDLSELQDSLGVDIDLNSSFKLSQGPIANKIITNANFAPERQRLMIFNQVCKRTVARSGDPLSHCIVKIHRCQYTYMYLLSPLRAVTIEKCHDTMIFLGPVETSINLLLCENVQVFAVTRKIVINSCRNCTFYLFTETKPVLVGTNEEIYFAPYNTYYPSLLQDMTVVGLTVSFNFWKYPLLLGTDLKAMENSWSELSREEFYRVSIPFDMEGETTECPFELPEKYQEALHTRVRVIEQWHKTVRESELSRDQRKQLQSLVQNRFQEWLKVTGNQLLLESLAPPPR